MPKKKSISERELRRIATRKANYGEDFDSRNGKYSSSFTRSKFNSETGRAAALKRQQMIREQKAKERGESPGGTVL